MLRRTSLIWLMVVAIVFAACSTDDTPLDNYQLSLAELPTNNYGTANTIGLDTGENLPLSQSITGLTADTIYRIQALYVIQSGRVALNNYAFVLAPEVKKHSEAYRIYDPLDVTTCWKTAHYINLRLAVKGSASGKHYYGFHQTGYIYNADGSRTMTVHLIHNQNKDPLYYTRDTYISLPLRPLAHLLLAGRDSLSLSVTTFEGERSYSFAL